MLFLFPDDSCGCAEKKINHLNSLHRVDWYVPPSDDWVRWSEHAMNNHSNLSRYKPALIQHHQRFPHCGVTGPEWTVFILCACVHTQIWTGQVGWGVQQEACRRKLHQRREQGARLHGCEGIFTVGHDLQALRGKVKQSPVTTCFCSSGSVVWFVISLSPAGRKDKRTSEAAPAGSRPRAAHEAIHRRNRKPYCFARPNVNTISICTSLFTSLLHAMQRHSMVFMKKWNSGHIFSTNLNYCVYF